MQKLTTSILTLVTVLSMNACNKQSKETTTDQPATDTTITSVASDTKAVELSGDYCFLKAENRDTTIVRLRILSSDDIRGEMIWNPYEKDGAVGTLTGKTNANNELELLYSYTIEGSQQTETKLMKIDNNQLSIKTGELIDPKNDGNLIFKDASKAVYNEVLKAIKCD